MHRLSLDVTPGRFVDHINGDGLDNRRSNLRIATVSQNNSNVGMTRQRTGLRGVYQRRSGRWGSQISQNGRLIYLGTFDTAVEAALAYDNAVREMKGPFGVTNASLGFIHGEVNHGHD